ncbi:hypothetical protein QQS21_011613 [Conoideocrella luteorostrata]|uniref:Uncharacterized protein n=1 Tax=Conoideocrella luteorostrata TaxID=1105319 RepID=A0AAJ0CDV8_9HYPO|nr:hypothetical protein QQS21_011613 [Conoideocrella luteorostrata]
MNNSVVCMISSSELFRQHDIGWDLSCVEYGDDLDSPYIQQVRQLGLEELLKISKAGTYDERYQLLHASSSPKASDNFLHEGLREANEHNADFFLGGQAPEDEASYIKQPFFADSNTDPKDAWQWAHDGESWMGWVNQENREDLRRWGYVMWDKHRLDQLGVFNKPWEDVFNSEKLVRREREFSRQRVYMRNAWDQREQVSRRGGSGWWSWGDESKVEWRDGAQPKPARQSNSVPEIKKPHSLSQARWLLKNMKLPVLSAGSVSS